MKPDDTLEKFCKYCEKASTLDDPDQMLCRYHGVVSAAHLCRRFRYDPLKRQPKRNALPALEIEADSPLPELRPDAEPDAKAEPGADAAPEAGTEAGAPSESADADEKSPAAEAVGASDNV